MQSSVHQTEALLFFTLLQLVVIVLTARLAGEIAVRISQSRAVGEIIAGLVLGPSLFGWLFPDLFGFVFRSVPSEPMTILSQVGLILLMFQIGLEFDFGHLRTDHNRNAVLRISAAGLAGPFVLGLLFGYLSAPYLAPEINRVGYCLFVATAFSITALPTLGRILMELGLTRTRVGVIAISSAVVNDVAGWLMLAVVTALTVSRFSPAEFAMKVALIGIYVAFCWWVVRPLLLRLLLRSRARAQDISPNLLGILIGAIFISGIATYHLGIFAIFGGFMMGVLLHDQPPVVQAWRDKVGQFVLVFFLPIFFTYTGLRTDVNALDSPALWGWCLLLLFLATIGKFLACYLAARHSGLDSRESKAIGIMMNTRALMELIVINVGLDLGVIPPSVFTMLVIMAVVSTIVTTPALRAWLSARPPAAAAQQLKADEP
ncbi:MAG TPA: cation:proton antiporter [Burkholderiales bacterium]|jgi:Kef-type K+ transport system membrane component KefB|nr:cation:proton antiporter [Burkholderiales bacterium]